MSLTPAEIVARHAVERPIPCDAERWRTSLTNYGFPGMVPDQLLDRVAQNSNRITRDMVFDYQDGDPLDLLVASMLWGFGPISYGPYRTAQMLKERDVSVSVTSIVDDIRTAARESPSAGFASLFSSGRTRIRQLGIAMGTKLLYFSAGRRDERQMPLILDKIVFTACRRVDIEAPDPRRYTTSHSYSSYCTAMANRAESLTVQPDVLEMSLFNWQQNG